MTMAAAGPSSFKLEVSGEVLAGIRARVEEFDFSELAPRSGWGSGASAEALRELTAHWLEGYDWRAQEAALNRSEQLSAEVGGTQLHALRERGSGGSSLTLVLLHGWPYSFASFRHVVEPLAHPERFGGDPEQGVTVVAPSLPGYGFSSLAPAALSFRDAAGLLDEFLTGPLGVGPYVVHGGDQGAPIAEWMAFDHPEHCAGLHTPLLALRPDGAPFASGLTGVEDAAEEEIAFVEAERDLNSGPDGAYFLLQLMTPQTIAPALLDSPVGLAAWMMEKFRLWSDRREGDPETGIGLDDILTEVMVYLVTGTVGTSLVAYSEYFDGPLTLPPGERIEVPSGYASYRDPRGALAPRSFAERTRDLVYWSEPARGGHFPSLEAPETFVADMRAFLVAAGV
jgi:pimeloyl-ACP methyl ester carboxylesterase